MLQSGFKTRQVQKGNFPILPEDTYQAVIEDVNLVEQPVYESPGEKEEVLNFQFLILEEGEYAGQRVWKKVRPILNAGFDQGQPSWLYELSKAVMKALPNDKQLEEGLSAEDLNELIGKQARLIIKIKTSKKGKEYNNITGILASKKDVDVPKLKTKEPGPVRKLTQEGSEEPQEDIFADDEYRDINAKLAGKSKAELVGEEDIPVIEE